MKKMAIFVLAVLCTLCGCCKRSPVIYAPDTRIHVNEEYNALDGVYALDRVDGDISDNVTVVSGMLDTQTPGRYRLRYEVTNSRGNTVRASRVIIVREQDPNFFHIWLAVCVPILTVLFACMALGMRRGKRRGSYVCTPPQDIQ